MALNLREIREAKDASGNLFRSIQRQKDQYQGIWIVSAEGKVLSGHHQVKDEKNWTQEIMATIDAALTVSGPLTARKVSRVEPLPHRGIGVRPQGQVDLAIYSRYMIGDRPDGPVVIDTLTLDKGEWSSFLAPEWKVGTEWSVPVTVVRKLGRLLSPNSDQSTMPRPDDVKVAELKATVESISDKKAHIRFAGKLEARHLLEGDAARPSLSGANVEGIAVYNLEKKSMDSLFIVTTGSYRHSPPNDELRSTGAVVEWRRERKQ